MHYGSYLLNKHLHVTFNEPGPVLSVLEILTHLILIATLCGR